MTPALTNIIIVVALVALACSVATVADEAITLRHRALVRDVTFDIVNDEETLGSSPFPSEGPVDKFAWRKRSSYAYVRTLVANFRDEERPLIGYPERPNNVWSDEEYHEYFRDKIALWSNYTYEIRNNGKVGIRRYTLDVNRAEAGSCRAIRDALVSKAKADRTGFKLSNYHKRYSTAICFEGTGNGATMQLANGSLPSYFHEFGHRLGWGHNSKFHRLDDGSWSHMSDYGDLLSCSGGMELARGIDHFGPEGFTPMQKHAFGWFDKDDYVNLVPGKVYRLRTIHERTIANSPYPMSLTWYDTVYDSAAWFSFYKYPLVFGSEYEKSEGENAHKDGLGFAMHVPRLREGSASSMLGTFGKYHVHPNGLVFETLAYNDDYVDVQVTYDSSLQRSWAPQFNMRVYAKRPRFRSHYSTTTINLQLQRNFNEKKIDPFAISNYASVVCDWGTFTSGTPNVNKKGFNGAVEDVRFEGTFVVIHLHGLTDFVLAMDRISARMRFMSIIDSVTNGATAPAPQIDAAEVFSKYWSLVLMCAQRFEGDPLYIGEDTAEILFPLDPSDAATSNEGKKAECQRRALTFALTLRQDFKAFSLHPSIRTKDYLQIHTGVAFGKLKLDIVADRRVSRELSFADKSSNFSALAKEAVQGDDLSTRSDFHPTNIEVLARFSPYSVLAKVARGSFAEKLDTAQGTVVAVLADARTKELSADYDRVSFLQTVTLISQRALIYGAGEVFSVKLEKNRVLLIAHFRNEQRRGAVRGLFAALRVARELFKLGFKASIGVSSGDCRIGTLGDSFRHKHAVLGSVPHLATFLARRSISLQSPFVILDQATFVHLPASLSMRFGASKAFVQGFDEALQIFFPEGSLDTGSENEERLELAAVRNELSLIEDIRFARVADANPIDVRRLIFDDTSVSLVDEIIAATVDVEQAEIIHEIVQYVAVMAAASPDIHVGILQSVLPDSCSDEDLALALRVLQVKLQVLRKVGHGVFWVNNSEKDFMPLYATLMPFFRKKAHFELARIYESRMGPPGTWSRSNEAELEILIGSHFGQAGAEHHMLACTYINKGLGKVDGDDERVVKLSLRSSEVGPG
ncbi:Hypothetical Protein FCC1311_001932 [Hondaea fermentalgiana]|uniref:Uncharacterized protein n=1 Tax=Hondaea fermentalgiana TaxID=2315210 RepID=A0A2R5G8G5_9STRA|nr:Hypothetical Protein FCC1311_001932 [Hondaea fermentalgiana]|eukprot:GBG23974.1 Hypothetical Protein FCC1311_001932 [Hondaea fermentalgiana]